eukprot:TRINITY_DN7245_c1_g1_i1.p1 TRINITY_DN7245_c1_g1~~TRINITY_DN7245_c1_g1_i1.p1  ORF type:complete len:211 (-),score=16.91 TRINITY_DN7245_c1_g1_i1:81-713(-)
MLNGVSATAGLRGTIIMRAALVCIVLLLACACVHAETLHHESHYYGEMTASQVPTPSSSDASGRFFCKLDRVFKTLQCVYQHSVDDAINVRLFIGSPLEPGTSIHEFSGVESVVEHTETVTLQASAGFTLEEIEQAILDERAGLEVVSLALPDGAIRGQFDRVTRLAPTPPTPPVPGLETAGGTASGSSDAVALRVSLLVLLCALGALVL